jgi:hypothetical protein
MRHRVVLTEALFHVGLEFQKALDVIDTGAGVCEAFFLLQHWLLVRFFCRPILIEVAVMAVA